MQLIGTKILGIMVQIKKNIGKCEILPLALHLARTRHIYIQSNPYELANLSRPQ